MRAGNWERWTVCAKVGEGGGQSQRTIFRGVHLERLAAGQHIVHALDTCVRPFGDHRAHARYPPTDHLLQPEDTDEKPQRWKACDADEVDAKDHAQNDDIGRGEPQHVKEGEGHLEALHVDRDDVCRLPCGRLQKRRVAE